MTICLENQMYAWLKKEYERLPKVAAVRVNKLVIDNKKFRHPFFFTCIARVGGFHTMNVNPSEDGARLHGRVTTITEGDLVTSSQAGVSMPMNWKLAIDTFGETYHFQVLHKHT